MKEEASVQINDPTLKELGKFDAMPQFAYLWDRCVYELLYNPEEYTKEFCAMLEQHGVTKDSEILDTSAGSGFPSLDMFKLGYKNITCVDGTDDQVALFNSKAKKDSLDIKSEKHLWEELPIHFSPESFNALVCKGSIWYAGGGWNKDLNPTRETSLEAIRNTLRIFYSLLKKGGVLYVDKFKDSEVDHKDRVGIFEVEGHKKELIFLTHRMREEGIRKAQMIVKDIKTGVEEGLPNITYDLKEEELGQLLRDVGFTVTKPNLTEEKFFEQWLAIKE